MVIDGASLLLKLSHAIVSQYLFTPNGTVERMVKKLHLYNRAIVFLCCEWINIGVAMLVLVNCKREVHSNDRKKLYPCYCASLRNMNSLTELFIYVGLGHNYNWE